MSKRKSAPRMTQDSGQAGVQLQTPRGKTVSQTAHTEPLFQKPTDEGEGQAHTHPPFLGSDFCAGPRVYRFHHRNYGSPGARPFLAPADPPFPRTFSQG